MSESVHQPSLGELQDRVWKQVERENKTKTAKRYRRCFETFVEWVEENNDIENVLGVSELNIKDYISYLWRDEDGPQYAGKTVNTYRAAVWRFFDELPEVVERHGYDVDVPIPNPADDLDIDEWHIAERTQKSIESRDPNNINWFTLDEKEQLIENVGEPEKRNILLIRLLYQTGCRRSEIVDIRLSDMDMDERSINIRTAKKDEHDEDSIRKVWWRPSLDGLLNEWIDVYRSAFPMAEESRYLFPGERQEHLSEGQVNYIVQKAAENANIQELIYTDQGGNKRYKYNAHSLRHLHGVQSVRNNVNVRFLQKEMGHSSIETTEIYMNVANKDIRNEFRRKGPGSESVE